MATKTNPGKFDCYTKAAPNEPMFILLARDPTAPQLVGLWAETYLRKKQRLGTCDSSVEEKFEEAMACAKSMRDWLRATERDERG